MPITLNYGLTRGINCKTERYLHLHILIQHPRLKHPIKLRSVYIDVGKRLNNVESAALANPSFLPIVGNKIDPKTTHKTEDVICTIIAVPDLFSHLNNGKNPPLGV